MLLLDKDKKIIAKPLKRIINKYKQMINKLKRMIICYCILILTVLFLRIDFLEKSQTILY